MPPGARNAADALLTIFRHTQSAPSGYRTQGHAVYNHCCLWNDRNADGRSEPDELIELRDRFTAVGLGFATVHWLDPHGNDIRFQGWLHTRTDGPRQGEPESRRGRTRRQWRMFEVALRTTRR